MLKKVAAGVGIFIAAWFPTLAIVGILGSSNIVWGEDNQYGRVDVPSTKVLHLPGREIDVSLAVEIVGKGNETVDVPVPRNLALHVTPAAGGPAVAQDTDLGDGDNAMGDGVNSQVRVWKIKVPHDGDYKVVTDGTFNGAEINPQLWFGHGPPIPGGWVPVLTTIIVVLGGLAFFSARRLHERREQRAPLP